MSKSLSFASLALAAALGFVAPASAQVIGNSPGPYQIITITGGSSGPLTATFSNGAGFGTFYEGVDDVFYLVQNNSGQTVQNINLSGGSNSFGFEVDGIGAGPFPAGPCGTGAPCTTPSLVDNTSGYGGPISFFSVPPQPVGAMDSGSVFFAGGLAPTASTIFALEAPAGTVSVTGINVATPLPAALPLFAGGLGVMGLLARRRKRKAAQA